MENNTSYRFRKKNARDIKIGFYNTPTGTIHTGQVRESWHKTKKEFFGIINYPDQKPKAIYENSIEEVEKQVINDLSSRLENLSMVYMEAKGIDKELKKFVKIAKEKSLKEATQDYRLQKGSKKYLPNPTPKLNNSGEEK